jgi:hypothetical protein
MGWGSEIRDPEKTCPGFRDKKKHRIPDPDPQHYRFFADFLFSFQPTQKGVFTSNQIEESLTIRLLNFSTLE